MTLLMNHSAIYVKGVTSWNRIMMPQGTHVSNSRGQRYWHFFVAVQAICRDQRLHTIEVS